MLDRARPGIGPVLVLCLMTPKVQAQKAVYLVRHAEKAESFDGDEARWPLTDRGARQAEALAVRLADAGITAIYLSTLDRGGELSVVERTRGTAAPLLKRLQERGVRVAEHRIPYPVTMRPGSLDPDELARYLDQLERYAEGVRDSIRADHPDEVVLIVGHDNTIPAILRAMGCRGEVSIGPREFDHRFVVLPRGGPEGNRPPRLFHLEHSAQEAPAPTMSAPK